MHVLVLHARYFKVKNYIFFESFFENWKSGNLIRRPEQIVMLIDFQNQFVGKCKLEKNGKNLLQRIDLFITSLFPDSSL